jgi:ribosomal protein L29
MKIKEKQELRKKSIAELKISLEKIEQELFKALMARGKSELKNIKKPSLLKKKIAAIKTFIREKQPKKEVKK